MRFNFWTPIPKIERVHVDTENVAKMETLFKILDVLLEAMGPSVVKEHCDKQEKPPEQKKIIIKKVKKPSAKTDNDMEELSAGLEGLTIEKKTSSIDDLTSQLQGLTIQKAEPKPKSKPAKRCDARIYGEKFLIEGTTSPNGTPYAVYKHAQCEANATHCITDEDDGKLYLCKMCMKRYSSRDTYPVVWHGFFDDDSPPATSHFLNGAWHRAKLAAVH